jgi:outer membrane protein TolC
MFPFPLFRRLAAVTAAATLCSFVVAPALAQQALTLQDAQRIAVARSQQLVAQDAALAATREMAVAAGQLPDPVLKLGVDNLPLNGPDRWTLTQDFMTMRRIGVMQELPGVDKRRLKVERVERDRQRIEAERELAVGSVQRDTALAWMDRYYTQAMLVLVRKQIEETQLQMQGAEASYRGGRGNQADVLAARSALAGSRDKLRQLEAQARSAGLVLARWVGAEAAAQPLAGVVNWQDSAVIDHLTRDHLRIHPELAALAAEVDAADTELRQAQANTSADWTVEATYSQRGPAYSNMLSVGVSIPLQLDRAKRQDRDVAAKLAALTQARARFEDALNAHEAETGALLNDWTAGKDRVTQLAAELLPAATQRSEGALASYRGGKGDLASVLSARRDEIDARLQLLTLEMETARLWAKLNYLVPDHGDTGTRKE